MTTSIERIREQVERVREEHVKFGQAGICLSCNEYEREVLWPCPTLRFAEKMLKLAEALEGLTDKIGRIIQSPEWSAVWTVAHVHGQVYKGETFDKELAEAERILAEVAE